MLSKKIYYILFAVVLFVVLTCSGITGNFIETYANAVPAIKPIACLSNIKNINEYNDKIKFELERGEKLELLQESIKNTLNKCQAGMNSDNLTADQKATLIAAQNQLTITKNILNKANQANSKTEAALQNQNKINEIIKQYESELVKTLQDANKKIDNNNNKMEIKNNKNGVLVSINDYGEFFANVSGSSWQDEWKKDFE